MISTLSLLVLRLALPAAFGTAINPDIEWKELETAHFEIVYDARNQQLAEEYAAQAERAHTILAPLFPVLPKSKTVLIVNDFTDQANGFATCFPRNQVSVFPVLPTMMDSINYYDNWSQQLIL